MSDEGKTVIRNSALLLAATGGAAVVGYAMRLVLTRRLDIDQFGLLFAVVTALGMTAVVKDLGMLRSMVYHIARYSEQSKNGLVVRVAHVTRNFSFLSAVAVMVLWLVFAQVLAREFFESPLAATLLYILAPYIVLVSLVDYYEYVLQAYRKTSIYAWRGLIFNGVLLIGALLIAESSAVQFSFAYLVAALVLLSLYATAVHRVLPSTTPSSSQKVQLRKLLSYGLPLYIGMIAGQLMTNVDTMMITAFRNLAEVGLYQVAVPTTQFLWLAGSAASVVLFPTVSSLWSKQKREEISGLVVALTKYLSIALVPAVIIIMMFPQQLLLILFGAEYAAASEALRILAVGMAFFSISFIPVTTTQAVGLHKRMMYRLLVIGAINAIANLLLIPRLGIVGAAISSAGSYVLLYFSSQRLTQEVFHLRFQKRFILKLAISGGIFFIATGYVKSLTPPTMMYAALSIVLGGMLYLGSLFIMRIISVEDIRQNVRTLWTQ